MTHKLCVTALSVKGFMKIRQLDLILICMVLRYITVKYVTVNQKAVKLSGHIQMIILTVSF